MRSPPLEQPRVVPDVLQPQYPQVVLLPARFVGLDLHKKQVTVAILDAKQDVVLSPRQVNVQEFATWARKNLTSADKVVLEATSNAWQIVDELEPLVGSVTVAEPYATKAMMSGRIKTDNRDAVKLARLLAAGIIEKVWVPPIHVRELRGLVAHRLRLVRQRTQARNRLNSVLHRHNLVPPSGGLFSDCNSSWWEQLELSPSEKLRVRQDLAILACLEGLIKETEKELFRLSVAEPWASQVPFVLQAAGIGVVSTMTLLSAIGDISRFPTAKKVVGYSGLGVSVHLSGQTHRGGGITKEGRREMRTTAIQCAWRAVASSVHWKKEFERLEVLIGTNKAIVAIARKLLVVIWHVLTKRVADHHGDSEKVALKFVEWAYDLGKEGRQGVSPALFARRKLRLLKLGELMYTITRGGRPYHLPLETDDELAAAP